MNERGGTTAPDAHSWLYEALKAHPDLAKVSVVDGHPGTQVKPEMVIVGRILSPEQEDAAIGQLRRDERYVIEVLVDVELARKSGSEVRRRAFDLMRVVERVVRENPTLGDSLHADGVAAIYGAPDIVPQFTELGHVTIIAIRVGCRARI